MAPSLKSDCCSGLGLFLNLMKFKGKTDSISQTPASPFCHDGAGGCSPALGLRGVAPGHRSGPRRLPLDPFHSPRLPRHRHPQPGGSGHLWVYAADAATLVSEPLSGPGSTCLLAPPPQVLVPPACAQAPLLLGAPTPSIHLPHTCRTSSFQRLLPPWELERGRRGRGGRPLGPGQSFWAWPPGGHQETWPLQPPRATCSARVGK